MPVFELNAQNGLFFDHREPVRGDGKTFIFFNALTGDTGMWEGGVGPGVREAGHGTLSFNYRGQADSPFAPNTALTPALIVEDAMRLIADIRPGRSILVGLSIGGLFAARAWLGGIQANGLVLINTLRRDGPRLKWINDALVRCAEVGGLGLFRDLYVPLLFGEERLARHRADFLKQADYVPLARDSGHYNLLVHTGAADWDLPLERIDLPVLVLCGIQDHVFYDPSDIAELFQRLPDARRTDIGDVGRLIPAEAPERLAQLLVDFAEGV